MIMTGEIDRKRERRTWGWIGLGQQVEPLAAQPSDPENRLLCAVYIGEMQRRGSTSEAFFLF